MTVLGSNVLQKKDTYVSISIEGKNYQYDPKSERTHELGTEFTLVENDKTLVRIDGFAGWGKETKQQFVEALEQAKQLDATYAIKVLAHNLKLDARQNLLGYFVIFTQVDLARLEQQLLTHDFFDRSEILSSDTEAISWIDTIAKALGNFGNPFTWQIALCPSAIYLEKREGRHPFKKASYHVIFRDVGLNSLPYDKLLWLEHLPSEQLEYLSPEEKDPIVPQNQSSQSQVYSLALLLLDLLKCQHPTREEDSLEKIESNIKKQISGVNDLFIQTLAKALSIDPRDRFSSPSEFVTKVKESLENKANKIIDVTVSKSLQESIDNKSPNQIVPLTQSSLNSIYYQYKGEHKFEEQRFPPQVRYLMVGSDPNNDIVLEQVGARQLCIWRVSDGWYTVTELGDGIEQRTYQAARLNNISLSPQYAANLTSEDQITIGNWSLWLGNPLNQRAVAKEHKVGRIKAIHKDFIVKSSDPLSIPIQVSNFSNVVEDFWIVVDGAPANWRIIAPDVQCHSPNAEVTDPNKKSTEKAEIQIFLPPAAQSISKTYTLVVRLISSNRQVQVAADTVRVQLEPDFNFRCVLTPKSVRLRREMRLTVENQGNFTQTFFVHFSDEKSAVDFQPSEARVVVRPGTKEEIWFRPMSAEWHLFGRERTHQITVEVQPEGTNKTDVISGQATSMAIFRPWLLGILAVLLLLFIVMSSTLLKPQFKAQEIFQGGGLSDSLVSGSAARLHWEADNYCFSTIYRNDILIQPLNWRMKVYTITNPLANSMYEVQLRNCLFVSAKNWQIPVITPSPTSLPALNVLAFSTIPTSTLIGQSGDLCFYWQVDSLPTSLKIEPAVGDVDPVAGSKCVPLISVINSANTFIFSLKAINADGNTSTKTTTFAAYAPECPVSEGPLNVREGPGTEYSPLFQVPANQVMRLLGRPFYTALPTNGVWAEVAVIGNDPRTGWVDFAYLNCKEEIRSLLNALPLSQPPPPTATPEPTATLVPTVTPVPPTPTPASDVVINITPNVITKGQCAVLSWNIQNVISIHLNGDPQVGQGEVAKCPETTTTYIFSIVQRNNVTVEQKKILVVNPLPVTPTEPLPPGQ